MTSSQVKTNGRGAPALPSPSRPAGVLPLQFDRLIGRDVELDQICALLRSNRLVTLTGPGGVGKTRLAVEAARLSEYALPNGVTFVSLAPVRKPELLLPAIADALGIERAGTITTAVALERHLAAERRLLLLDNFEQILEAGPELTTLLAVCPNLSFLVTSRAVLRLRGERVYDVRPLTLPGPGRPRSAAVELFVDRAQSSDANFALDPGNIDDVAAICQRLDGLPLAIELAAARIRVLPPKALLSRLDRALPLLTSGRRDALSHQRTLRDTLAWSYEVLSVDARRIFRQLSVFLGGFTLEAAEAVSGDRDPAVVVETLSELVDHSLVRPLEHVPHARFGMLELVREYGLELLEACGELEAARRAQAEWVAALVERLRPTIEGPDGAQVIERYDREHPNIRTALAYAIDAGDAQLANRIAAFVWKFWVVRGHGSEAREWLERTLKLTELVPPEHRLEVIYAAASFALDRNDLEEAEHWANVGLDLARMSSELLHEARMLWCLGVVADYRGDLETAARLFDEAIVIARALHVPGAFAEHMLAIFLTYGAYAALLKGDFERAQRTNEEASQIFTRRNDPWGMGLVVECFGSIAVARQRFDEAARRYQECMELYRGAGSRHGMVSTLTGLGIVAAGIGQDRAAASFFGASERARSRLLVPVPYALRREYDRALDLIRARLGERRFQEAWRAGLERELEDAVAEACALRVTPATDRLLSKRERNVLALLARGQSNQAIASQLCLSHRTVESHVSSILRKLDVPSRQMAVVTARERGMLDAGAD